MDNRNNPSSHNYSNPKTKINKKPCTHHQISKHIHKHIKKMKIAILGGGESGTGAAILAHKLNYEVFLSDKGTLSDKYKAILDKNNIEHEEGKHTEDRILEADLIIKSPGIPDNAPIIKRIIEKGIKLISEIEFAGINSKAKFICITGSNGKTTTTLLTHHILTTAGYKVGLAGNVGHSLAMQVANEDKPLYVVELSSFQLDTMYTFKADIAVVTNITPDHLDRYNYQMENYVNSKFRILNNMKANDLFIYGADNEEIAHKYTNLDIIPESLPFTYNEEKQRQGAWRDNNNLKCRLDKREYTIPFSEISIQGRHNIYNSMVATLISMRLGLSDKEITNGLKTFPQVEHRLEKFAHTQDTIFINDSKATNVDSAWYALDSINTPIIWIAGGTDKGNDYSPLFHFARTKVKLLIAMGTDNTKLLEQFSDKCKIISTNTLDEAINIIFENISIGDTVLLSPCCASFDLFKNYEDRGQLFKAAILKRLQQKDL